MGHLLQVLSMLIGVALSLRVIEPQAPSRNVSDDEWANLKKKFAESRKRFSDLRQEFSDSPVEFGDSMKRFDALRKKFAKEFAESRREFSGGLVERDENPEDYGLEDESKDDIGSLDWMLNMNDAQSEASSSSEKVVKLVEGSAYLRAKLVDVLRMFADLGKTFGGGGSRRATSDESEPLKEQEVGQQGSNYILVRGLLTSCLETSAELLDRCGKLPQELLGNCWRTAEEAADRCWRSAGDLLQGGFKSRQSRLNSDIPSFVSEKGFHHEVGNMQPVALLSSRQEVKSGRYEAATVGNNSSSPQTLTFSTTPSPGHLDLLFNPSPAVLAATPLWITRSNSVPTLPRSSSAASDIGNPGDLRRKFVADLRKRFHTDLRSKFGGRGLPLKPVTEPSIEEIEEDNEDAMAQRLLDRCFEAAGDLLERCLANTENGRHGRQQLGKCWRTAEEYVESCWRAAEDLLEFVQIEGVSPGGSSFAYSYPEATVSGDNADTIGEDTLEGNIADLKKKFVHDLRMKLNLDLPKDSSRDGADDSENPADEDVDRCLEASGGLLERCWRAAGKLLGICRSNAEESAKRCVEDATSSEVDEESDEESVASSEDSVDRYIAAGGRFGLIGKTFADLKNMFRGGVKSTDGASGEDEFEEDEVRLLAKHREMLESGLTIAEDLLENWIRVATRFEKDTYAGILNTSNHRRHAELRKKFADLRRIHGFTDDDFEDGNEHVETEGDDPERAVIRKKMAALGKTFADLRDNRGFHRTHHVPPRTSIAGDDEENDEVQSEAASSSDYKVDFGAGLAYMRRMFADLKEWFSRKVTKSVSEPESNADEEESYRDVAAHGLVQRCLRNAGALAERCWLGSLVLLRKCWSTAEVVVETCWRTAGGFRKDVQSNAVTSNETQLVTARSAEGAGLSDEDGVEGEPDRAAVMYLRQKFVDLWKTLGGSWFGSKRSQLLLETDREVAARKLLESCLEVVEELTRRCDGSSGVQHLECLKTAEDIVKSCQRAARDLLKEDTHSKGAESSLIPTPHENDIESADDVQPESAMSGEFEVESSTNRADGNATDAGLASLVKKFANWGRERGLLTLHDGEDENETEAVEHWFGKRAWLWQLVARKLLDRCLQAPEALLELCWRGPGKLFSRCRRSAAESAKSCWRAAAMSSENEVESAEGSAGLEDDRGDSEDSFDGSAAGTGWVYLMKKFANWRGELGNVGSLTLHDGEEAEHHEHLDVGGVEEEDGNDVVARILVDRCLQAAGALWEMCWRGPGKLLSRCQRSAAEAAKSCWRAAATSSKNEMESIEGSTERDMAPDVQELEDDLSEASRSGVTEEKNGGDTNDGNVANSSFAYFRRKLDDLRRKFEGNDSLSESSESTESPVEDSVEDGNTDGVARGLVKTCAKLAIEHWEICFKALGERMGKCWTTVEESMGSCWHAALKLLKNVQFKFTTAGEDEVEPRKGNVVEDSLAYMREKFAALRERFTLSDLQEDSSDNDAVYGLLEDCLAVAEDQLFTCYEATGDRLGKCWRTAEEAVKSCYNVTRVLVQDIRSKFTRSTGEDVSSGERSADGHVVPISGDDAEDVFAYFWKKFDDLRTALIGSEQTEHLAQDEIEEDGNTDALPRSVLEDCLEACEKQLEECFNDIGARLGTCWRSVEASMVMCWRTARGLVKEVQSNLAPSSEDASTSGEGSVNALTSSENEVKSEEGDVVNRLGYIRKSFADLRSFFGNSSSNSLSAPGDDNSFATASEDKFVSGEGSTDDDVAPMPRAKSDGGNASDESVGYFRKKFGDLKTAFGGGESLLAFGEGKNYPLGVGPKDVGAPPLLATCLEDTEQQLEQCFKVAGKRMEECWRSAEESLESCQKVAGGLLKSVQSKFAPPSESTISGGVDDGDRQNTTESVVAQNLLDSCLQRGGELLERCWNSTGRVLKSCWSFAQAGVESCWRAAKDLATFESSPSSEHGGKPSDEGMNVEIEDSVDAHMKPMSYQKEVKPGNTADSGLAYLRNTFADLRRRVGGSLFAPGEKPGMEEESNDDVVARGLLESCLEAAGELLERCSKAGGKMLGTCWRTAEESVEGCWRYAAGLLKAFQKKSATSSENDVKSGEDSKDGEVDDTTFGFLKQKLADLRAKIGGGNSSLPDETDEINEEETNRSVLARNLLESCLHGGGELLERCWNTPGKVLKRCWSAAEKAVESCKQAAQDLLKSVPPESPTSSESEGTSGAGNASNSSLAYLRKQVADVRKKFADLRRNIFGGVDTEDLDKVGKNKADPDQDDVNSKAAKSRSDEPTSRRSDGWSARIVLPFAFCLLSIMV